MPIFATTQPTNRQHWVFNLLKKEVIMTTDANKEKLVTVFTGTVWQAELIKGLLDTNDIPCAIMDETIGAITSSYSGLGKGVLVVVNEEDKEKALEVIKT
jgi:hypothetical protein